MDKNEIRKIYKDIRKNISNRQEKQELIFKNLTIFLDKYENILSFSSINDEVDTSKINSYIKNLALPLVCGVNMTAKRIFDLKTDLVLGSFNILEPLDILPDIEKIDVVLVPGLAFSRDFYRIGYGGGFYDRFLQNLDVIKIGICFDEQITCTLPFDDFDIPLDIIVTDKKIYKKNLLS